MKRFLDDNGFTPVGFFGGIAVMATAVLLLGVVINAAFAGVARENATRVSRSGYATTFRHDDHLFIRAFGGGLLHHPDCPCQKSEAIR